jgi:hypothetical protein
VSRRTLVLLFLAVLMMVVPYAYSSGEFDECMTMMYSPASKLADAMKGWGAPGSLCNFAPSGWVNGSFFLGVLTLIAAGVSFVRDCLQARRAASPSRGEPPTLSR